MKLVQVYQNFSSTISGGVFQFRSWALDVKGIAVAEVLSKFEKDRADMMSYSHTTVADEKRLQRPHHQWRDQGIIGYTGPCQLAEATAPDLSVDWFTSLRSPSAPNPRTPKEPPGDRCEPTHARSEPEVLVPIGVPLPPRPA